MELDKNVLRRRNSFRSQNSEGEISYFDLT